MIQFPWYKLLILLCSVLICLDPAVIVAAVSSRTANSLNFKFRAQLSYYLHTHVLKATVPIARGITCYYIEYFTYIADSAVSNELVTVPEGKVTFGKPVDFPSYGWDIEYGQLTMK